MTKPIILLFCFSALLIGCTQQVSNDNIIPESLLPSLYISIPQTDYDSILLSTDYKVSGRIVIVDAQGDTLCADSLKHIKTRGNSTFTERSKKAFTIKFPRAQKLFNLHKSKAFVLLANAFDESHIRNAIGLDISEAIGLPTPRYTFVSLYINDEYVGLYQMTNKVEINKHFLNITDLEKQNKLVNPHPLHSYPWEGRGIKNHIVQRKGYALDYSPSDISGGYLIEIAGWMDRYTKIDCGFQSPSGDLINIREPKYASKAEVDYIADYYNDFEQALIDSTGYNPITHRYYSEYINIRSFALSYIVNELILNLDAGVTSFYMYKDANDKLFAGPSWDFDRTLDGNFWYGRYNDVHQIYAGAKTGDIGFPTSNGIFYQLLKHADFQQAVRQEWNEHVSSICHEFIDNAQWNSLAAYIANDAERDYAKNGNRQSVDYNAAISRPLDFLRQRMDFLDAYWSRREDDLICVADSIADHTQGIHDRHIHFYYSVGEPIIYPTIPHEGEVYNHDPIQTFYVAGTDSIVPNGSVLEHPARLDMRWREPTWKEVQVRRIKKKLHRLF